jgi:uncharacterized protein YceH (UPF0502 family)
VTRVTFTATQLFQTQSVAALDSNVECSCDASRLHDLRIDVRETEHPAGPNAMDGTADRAENAPENATPSEVPQLHATERRLLGVLIEKGLTTPEYYPMTVNALIAGCNQKNNRDPVTQLDETSVVETLRSLEAKGLAASVIADTGRVNRWRQDLGRKFELNAVELGIVGELLLRGAQSEGDLRGRASRMRPIETLEVLRELLAHLRGKKFVVRLSPEGSARGVRWTHTLGPHEERQAEPEQKTNREVAAAPPLFATATHAAPPPSPDLVARIVALEARVARLEKLSGPPS